MNDIESWLRQHDLGKFADKFAENEVQLGDLSELTDEDVRDLGLPIGPRRRLQKAIRELVGDGPSELKDEDPTSHPKVEAERRQLTVMFCDLVGSTALSESMDPEDYRELLGTYQTAATSAIRNHDGYIARYMGDGLLVYFGYPVAAENDPERAARAGLAVVDAVTALDSPTPLEVRVGIATGPVVVGDIVGEGTSEEAAVLGETPNLAARLQGAAPPNTVLLSQTTQELLRGSVETEALAPVELRGFSRPIASHRAIRPRSPSEVSATQLDSSPLIGRDVEVALLQRAWQRAQSGEGQAVHLCGEPGVGKSRLLRAFQGSINEEQRTRVQWHCSAYHQTTANYPFIEQLKRSVRLDERGPDQSLNALVSMLDELGLDKKELLPALALLLPVPKDDRYEMPAMSPVALKRLLISTQVQLLLAAARHAPVLFIIEDLHWADPTTLDVLGEMIATIGDKRVLILLTARPEFSPPWSEQPHAITQRLTSLSRSETMALVQSFIEEHDLSPNVIEQIVERTDGVPLYVEELTKTLLESSDEAGVPASLKDSLMARLDRLGPAKELAQIASVIGRTFSFEALFSIAEWSEAAFEHGLEGLLGSGLVHRRGEESYEFKHALVRDVAYDSMLRDTRRGFHGRFAKHLMVNRQGESQPELLAHHQQEAALYDSAAQHWLRAGEHATMRGANREAIAHLRRGLASVAELGISERGRELELSLLSTLGPVLMQTFGYGSPDVGETYEQFRNLARSEVGTTAKWFDATFGLWLHSHGLAEFGRARELIGELFELCDAAPDESHRIQAQHAAWTTGLNTGEFASSHNFAKDAIKLYRPEEHGRHYLTYAGHDPCACAHIHNAMALWFLGYPERAVQQATFSLERANELSHPSTVVVSRFFGLLLRQFTQDAERVRTDAEAMIELTKAHGPATWLAASQVLLGWAIAALGDSTKGFSISQSGLCDYQASGNLVRDAYYRALHADVCLMDGRLGEGAELAEEALAVSERTGDTHWDAEIHRLAGELCYKRGDSEQGGEHLRRAVSIARTQDARILELRALLSLWHHTGSEPDRKRIHGELDRLYSSFDEGHQTKDLMAARQVLNSPPI